MKKQIKLILGVLAVTLVGASGFATSSSVQTQKEKVLANLRADLARLNEAKQERAQIMSCILGKKDMTAISAVLKCQNEKLQKLLDTGHSRLQAYKKFAFLLNATARFEDPAYLGQQESNPSNGRNLVNFIREKFVVLDQADDSQIKLIRYKILALSKASSDQDLVEVVRTLIKDEAQTIAILEKNLKNVSTLDQEREEDSVSTAALGTIGFFSGFALAGHPIGALGGGMAGVYLYDLTLIPIEKAEELVAESLKNEIQQRSQNLYALRLLASDLLMAK